MAERQRSDARLMTVVETREFQQRAATRMSEAERQAFITFIAGHPEDGAIMVGTGGIRKSRWGVGSRGKSGGVMNGTTCRSVRRISCTRWSRRL
jgi:hypothetical protein